MKTKIILLAILGLSQLCVAQQALAPTENAALLKVDVTTMEGIPSAGDIVTFTGQKTGEILSNKTDQNGSFALLLPKGDTYTVSYRLFDRNSEYSEIEVPNEEGLMTFTFSIAYSLPEVYTLNNVFFDSGKSTLKPASFEALDNLAELLLAKTKLNIELAGHTDNEGSDASNLTLSTDRAEAVVNYLLKKGVRPKQLQAKGYGESKPVASNETPAGRAQNRRTEVRILN